jgi:hypothetical protein
LGAPSPAAGSGVEPRGARRSERLPATRTGRPAWCGSHGCERGCSVVLPVLLLVVGG